MPTARAKSIRRVLVLEGACNLAVAAIKLAAGTATGSLVLVSDALHSATDLANNVLAWFAMRAAGRPADADHPYGHAKFETLSVFALATLSCVLALEILIGVVRRGARAEVSADAWALGAVAVALALQVAAAAWQAREARRLDSELLRADAAHTAADTATTVVALAGWQLSARGIPWIDGVLAVAVAALVLGFAYRLFRRAVPILVDGASVAAEDLRRAVEDVPGVERVGRARARWDGTRRVADVTVHVDGRLDAIAAHAVADRIEARLEERFAIAETVVHVEPHV